MNDFSLPSSQSTPAIQTDWAAGSISMQGDSYPENSYELFHQVFEWIEGFLATAERPFSLDLRLLYLNTSSIKAMMEIFDLLEAAHQQGKAVAVNWRYDRENERVVELAEEFKEDCTFPFSILSHN